MPGDTIELGDFVDASKFNPGASFCPCGGGIPFSICGGTADLSGHVSVDRGDPASFDFTEAGLTTDETWRDLDLSGVVPAGAVMVLLGVEVLDDAAGSFIMFRKKGNSNEIVTAKVRVQVANQPIEADRWCAVDSNRVIQYYGTDVAFTSIDIAVKGWIF